jgi:hypothetical protein
MVIGAWTLPEWCVLVWRSAVLQLDPGLELQVISDDETMGVSQGALGKRPLVWCITVKQL